MGEGLRRGKNAKGENARGVADDGEGWRIPYRQMPLPPSIAGEPGSRQSASA
jgi:hypothetical protein